MKQLVGCSLRYLLILWWVYKYVGLNWSLFSYRVQKKGLEFSSFNFTGKGFGSPGPIEQQIRFSSTCSSFIPGLHVLVHLEETKSISLGVVLFLLQVLNLMLRNSQGGRVWGELWGWGWKGPFKVIQPKPPALGVGLGAGSGPVEALPRYRHVSRCVTSISFGYPHFVYPGTASCRDDPKNSSSSSWAA